MKLVITTEIHFNDIDYSMPVGVLDGVSGELLRFAKETCNVARKDIVFADIHNHPDYSEHSRITGTRAMCCFHESVPCVMVFMLPAERSEGVIIHEMMHAWLYFEEGYDDASRLRGEHPFHIKLFAGRVGNIMADLHVHASMKRKGFEVASLRESGFDFLKEWSWLVRRPDLATSPGLQWQLGGILGHLCAGRHIYHFSNRNRRFLGEFERLCRERSPGVLHCRDLVVDAAAETGYDTSEKVARFVDLVTPPLFEFLGEEFRAEYLRPAAAPSGDRAMAAAV